MNPAFPLADHYDGRRFFNPGSPGASRGLLQVLRWRMRGQRTPWTGPAADPVLAPPPSVVPPAGVAISFINHASFLIRFPGAVLLTDPIFSLRCSPMSRVGPMRVRPPGIALADLPR